MSKKKSSSKKANNKPVVKDIGQDKQEDVLANEPEVPTAVVQEPVNEELEPVLEENNEDVSEESLNEETETTNEEEPDTPPSVVEPEIALTVHDIIKKVNANNKMSLLEKIKTVGDLVTSKTQTAFNTIDIYITEMAPLKATPPKVGAAMQNRLTRSLLNLLAIEDFEEFKAAWILVNKVYADKELDQFSSKYLNRYLTAWEWSMKDYKSHLVINDLLTMLCDPTTRAVNKKKVNHNKALDTDTTSLTETMVSNLTQFYKF